jgi:uroporphyrinogen III methyltransferase/synthase
VTASPPAATGAHATGFVHLVGAGPGDPGLLTVAGRDVLRWCDAVVYDALVAPAIMDDIARDGNEDVELHFVGKRGGDERSWKQDDINALLVRLAQEGKRVVRLKGGDPFVFGRGSEEAQALAAAGVAFDVIPGITAGIAAPAYAGIPVTHRAVATSVTFVTGHEDPAKEETQTDWRALARGGGTIVLYMGVGRIAHIATELRAGGLPDDTPAAAVQWGTLARQRTVDATLATLPAAIAESGLTAPVITVIGRVAALREEIAWFDRRPLFGRRVLVTRAQAQSAALSAPLRALGAEVLELPATRIEPLDMEALKDRLSFVEDYHWLVLTSQNAVDALWSGLRRLGCDSRWLQGVKLAAIGPATADALLARGLRADVIPTRFVAESLLEALASRPDVNGSRVLYVAAEGARDVLPEGLEELGARVDVVRAYRSVPDESASAALRASVERGEPELVTFSSAGAVRAYVDAVGPELARTIPAASIGPTTSEAARAAGITVAVQAERSDIPGLVEAVRAHFAGVRA